MKVALIKDVSGLGKKNDVKTVSDGYALNFLIPQKSAEVATAAVLARIELAKKQIEQEKKVMEDLLAKNLHTIHDKEVTIEREANEKGSLFAGIHKEEIVKAVKEEIDVDLLPEFIVLDKPLKEIGSHKIDLKVHGKSATFTLNIKAK
jgi:large subunit ribosomal protein L9